MILIWTGLILMIAGSAFAVIKRGFLNKLHMMGVSDVSGASLILIGLMIEGFEPGRIFIALVFLLVWVPLTTHVISKAFVSRVKR